MSEILFGKAIKYGNNIDTDVIIPARFLNTSDPKELARHCMEDIDSDYKNRMHSGEIMVAGKNFGCGSSREHAPIAIKASGISCIIAESFARIFFRNAINIGLPIIELKNAVGIIDSDDSLGINLIEGVIKNISKGTFYKINRHPEFMQEIIKSGGLIEMIKANLIKNNSD